MVYSKEYKQRIAFEYPCYICGIVLSKARQALNHIESTHGYNLPPRPVGRRRPVHPNYEYVNNPQTKSDFEVYHTSCASCFFHCLSDDKGLAHLANHINEKHEPINVNPAKNNNGELTGGQVDQLVRYKNLPDDDEEQDQLQIEDEDEDMDKTVVQQHKKPSDMNKKKENVANHKNIHDVYQKLTELTSMFQKLFTKEPERTGSNEEPENSHTNEEAR